MGEAIAAVLAYAVGVGLSPIPAVAGILVLLSVRARVNGPLFLAGWMAGLATMMTFVLLVADRVGAGSSDAADDGISWMRIVLGIALVLAAARKWRRRSGAGAEPPPAWMARIEGLRPPQAFGVGLLLSANPKNLALTLGAGVSLAELDVAARQVGTAVALFVFVGSVGLIAAVAFGLAGGAAARARLDEARSSLVVHNSAIVAVMYLVFGALLISRGLAPAR